MKSTLALFLGLLMLAGSLFPNSDVEEVYKIPGLIAHYQLHKKAAGTDFDFFQFLELHYTMGSKHAKTPHKGVKLPMYNHLAICYVFVLTKPQFIPSAISTLLWRAKQIFVYQNTYCLLRSVSLLQPPRLG